MHSLILAMLRGEIASGLVRSCSKWL
jgi:hypothetical protein